MRTHFYGKNLQVTESMKEYTLQKLERLDHGERAEHAELYTTFSLVGHQPLHKAELSFHGDGFTIRAEEVTSDMYASIDQAVSKLTIMFRRFQAKARDRRKHASAAPAVDGPDDADEGFRVERIKTVDLKPVDLQEAILQMNLLDHDFHVFLNEETGQTEVVYKRADGMYGLIRGA